MKFQCGTLHNSINDETTHVIVKTEQNLFAQRTLKYLQVLILVLGAADNMIVTITNYIFLTISAI